MITHDAIGALVVSRLAIRSGMLMSQYASYPTIAIRAEAVNDLPNVVQQRRVIQTAAGRTAVNPGLRTFQQCHEMTARHAKGRTYQSHRSSPGNNGERASHFFALAKFTASLRISFSSVLRPSAAS